MADVYVWSGATGAGTGADWANAYTSLQSALAGTTGTGPHYFFVDSGLNETVAGAAVNLNLATASAVGAILSVNRGGRTSGTNIDGILKGATISASNTFSVNIATARSQTLHIEGLIVQTNSGTSGLNLVNVANTANTDVVLTVSNCTISVLGSSSGSTIQFGPGGSSTAVAPFITLRDTILTTRNNTGGGAISINFCRLSAMGVTHAYASTNKAAQLFTFAAGTRCDATFQDCDLSGFNSTSGAYVLLTNMQGTLRFTNCKLSATPAYETGSWPAGSGEIAWVNADSGDTYNQYRLSKPQGILTQETTYYRNAGAKDINGSRIAWKLITLARCSEADPFVCPFIVRGLAALQSTTFTLELMRGNTTLLTDRQAWLRYDRITDASFPLGTMTSTRNAAPFIGTGANLSSSSETWAGSLANATPQKISQTSTPSELSPIRFQFLYAVSNDSSGVYIDPCVGISGQTDGPSVYWLADGTAWNSEPVAASSAGGGSIFGSSIIKGLV